MKQNAEFFGRQCPDDVETESVLAKMTSQFRSDDKVPVAGQRQALAVTRALSQQVEKGLGRLAPDVVLFVKLRGGGGRRG